MARRLNGDGRNAEQAELDPLLPMSRTATIHDIRTLLLSFYPMLVIETVEEERVHSILGPIAAGFRLPLFEWTITHGLVRLPSRERIVNTREPLQLLQYLERLPEEGIFHLKDFTRHLTNPTLTRLLREVATVFGKRCSFIVVTEESVELPREIEHLVAHYRLHFPDRDELREVVDNVVRSLSGYHPIHFEIEPPDFEELLTALGGLTLNQARQTVAFCAIEDGRLAPEDIRRALDRKAQIIKDDGLLEYFPAQDNRSELAGFQRLKEWLARARTGFGPKARELNLSSPRGILLLGIQGCGKSLAAKFVAREWKLPLLKLDAGRLYDKYIGESEKNLRRALEMAESMAPVVLWIDEIEKGLAPSGSDEADSGLSRRIFGTFVTWLQERKKQVFVIATANDISRLPSELLRKRRFDEIFFVDLPTMEERVDIFRIHLGLRKQDPSALDLDRLVLATEGFSGAEIEQTVVSGLYRALYRGQPLDTESLLEEIQGTVPLSVSRREDLARLRKMAERRFVNVR